MLNYSVLVTSVDNRMQYGLLVVGLAFGFGFLTIIGLLSVLRDLFPRRPLLPDARLHDYRENGGSLAEIEGSTQTSNVVDRTTAQ